MPSLHVTRLTFSYSSASVVLDDVSFDLDRGWTGLVGANGAGKTTLLRLLAGDLHAPEGTIRLVPTGASVLLCPQRVDDPDSRVVTLAGSWDAAAARLRGLLDLDPGEPDRWGTLSPGQRKRWQVAAALAVRPHVLLLDEPTNHLDRDARDLLARALGEYRGVGILVSHDRALLDELTTRTLRIDRGRLEVWGGGYSTARQAWEATEAEMHRARERAQEERRRAARLLDRAARSRASAEAQMRRAQRTAEIKDPDARGAVQTGRRAGAEARLGREVAVRRSALRRAEQRVERLRVGARPGGKISFPYQPAPKEWLVRLDLDRLVAGDTVLTGPVRAGVRRTDRIRVIGRNGAGKSTLLDALVRVAGIPADRLVHLRQELDLRESRDLCRSALSLADDELGQLLSLVAALGVDPDRLLASDTPSPGEARKLAMARGLATGAWMLVLDEPTNHLDLPSLERLQEALVAYPGAVVMVTHDDLLARAVTRVEWRLAEGRFTVHL